MVYEKFCVKCGASVRKGYRFCRHCSRQMILADLEHGHLHFKEFLKDRGM